MTRNGNMETHTVKVPMPAHGFKSSDWSIL